MKSKLNKIVFALIVMLLSASLVSAQNTKSPAITFRDEDGDKAELKIKSVDVDIKVLGTVAVTTMDILFENELDRILEGELNFPLGEGQTVSRFAMDVNGNLREGVVVEKEKGRVVFEKIVRRRVDPGLLEMTKGNNFKSRVYPIPAKGTKRIVIAYEEILKENIEGMTYNLPLNFPDALESFTLQTVVYKTLEEPKIESNITAGKFQKSSEGYAFLTKLKAFKAQNPFTFMMPGSKEKEAIYIEETNGKTYFLINSFPKKVEVEKILPSKICLLIDISSSSANRDIDKEISALDGYFKKIGNCMVELIPFHIKAEASQEYNVSAGNWESLKQKIKSFKYDGGTQLGALDLKKYYCDEFIILSDGISNFGEKDIQLSPTPVLAINSNQTAEHSYLRYIAFAAGGRYINLLNQTTEEAIAAMSGTTYSFLSADYPAGTIVESYPQITTPIDGRFSFTGQLDRDNIEISLNYGVGKQILHREKYLLSKEKYQTESGLISRLWAQKKLAELDMQYEKNKDEITKLGKEYSIVTRNTSLIVLETLEDYLRYEIVPPEELKEEYFAKVKEKEVDRTKDSTRHKERILRLFKGKKDWFDNTEEGKLKYQLRPSVSPGKSGLITFVQDSSGNPIKLVSIKLTGTEGKAFYTDNDGLRSMVMKPGFYHYRIYKYGYLTIKGSFELFADEISYLSFELKPDSINISKPDTVKIVHPNLIPGKGMLVGTVKDSSERGLIGAQVRVLGTTRGAIVRHPDGSFKIVNIDPGVYEIKITMIGYPPYLYPLNIISDSTSSLFISLEEDTLNVVEARVYATRVADSRATGATAEITTEESVDALAREEIGGQSLYTNVDFELADSPLSAEESSEGFFSGWFDSDDEDESEEYGGAMGGVVNTTMRRGSRANVQGSPLAAKGGPSKKNISTIEIKPYDSDAPYLDDLEDLRGEEFFVEYFDAKDEYGMNPGFYLDVSDLVAAYDKELALRILSNIAEMKLEESSLMRVLAHRLQQLGYYNLAILCFKDVVKMRGEEPQSYRDLGLAYLDNKEYQNAADMLFKVVATKWDGRFPDIELIAIGELNKVIAESKGTVNTSNYWEEILFNMPVDIRVVMTWDADNTDIDLWVTDPKNEKCFYSHPRTKIGGLMSKDFTRGYGPEEFLLKDALPGTYKVEANYYGSSAQKLQGPVVLQLMLYTKYASDEEVRKEITVRLSDKKEVIEIGEFEFSE